MKLKTRRTWNPKKIKFSACVLIASCIAIGAIFVAHRVLHPIKYLYSDQDTLSVEVPYINQGEIDTKTFEIPRGTKVTLEKEGKKESSFIFEGMEITLNNSYFKDSLKECLQIEAVYPRRLVNLRKEKNGVLTDVIAEKGEKLKVTNVDVEDFDSTTGSIGWYQVQKDGKTYWLSGSYVETSQELALQNWNQNILYSTYWDETYGSGYSKDAYVDQIDYKPIKKESYENNPIPEAVNAVHVSLNTLIENKDYFLNLNQSTAINSYVVELKSDYGYIWYESEAAKQYLDDPAQVESNALLSLDELESLIQEFQKAGYYMIGRIVTFKDELYATQNPKEAICSENGELIYHNGEYWPSAYSRKAWMYNVSIAKEIASLGINEIQFDYVRFPDGLSALSSNVDLRNKYDESKTSAIQGFLQYAKEELSPYKVYVAADVFAWPLIAQDDQDIGQFFLAIANTVDVINPMPYSDHFSNGSMGIEDPGSHPGLVIETYTKFAKEELSKLKYPCIYRTWIQGYGNLSSEEIISQIQGIQTNGYSGYMVWYGNGNPEDLNTNKDGYVDSKKIS